MDNWLHTVGVSIKEISLLPISIPDKPTKAQRFQLQQTKVEMLITETSDIGKASSNSGQDKDKLRAVDDIKCIIHLRQIIDNPESSYIQPKGNLFYANTSSLSAQVSSNSLKLAKWTGR